MENRLQWRFVCSHTAGREKNQLEIYNTVQFCSRLIPRKTIWWWGIARGYDAAVELVKPL